MTVLIVEGLVLGGRAGAYPATCATAPEARVVPVHDGCPAAGEVNRPGRDRRAAHGTCLVVVQPSLTRWRMNGTTSPMPVRPALLNCVPQYVQEACGAKDAIGYPAAGREGARTDTHTALQVPERIQGVWGAVRVSGAALSEPGVALSLLCMTSQGSGRRCIRPSSNAWLVAYRIRGVQMDRSYPSSGETRVGSNGYGNSVDSISAESLELEAEGVAALPGSSRRAQCMSAPG